jgi:phosphomannomutase
MSDISKFFKAYDVRGTVPELTAEIYYLVAQGLVETILKPEGLPLTVNMCRDVRYSSPEFYKAFYNGLLSVGATPIAIGFGPSELLYAACQVNDMAGAMITASHNPKDDNGIKMVKKVPQMLGIESGLAKIRDYVIEKMDAGFNIGIVDMVEVQEDGEFQKKVVDFLFDKFKTVGQVDQINTILAQSNKKLKVVADTANGMGGFLMPYIAAMYPNIEFVPMFWELDGNFPNHPADPMADENIKYLQDAVLAHGADFGIAFDGDADRAFFVDEKGERINGEFLVPAFAKYMVKEAIDKPELGLSPAVAFPISYSRATLDTVYENNGVPVGTKQGHTFIKTKMAQYNAVYGGEASGHHYYGQFGFMDSGALTVALLVRILVENDQKASSVLDYWKSKYFVSGEHNFKLVEGLTMAVIREKLLATYSDATISEMEGITIYYPEWKFTVRGSNTEPLIRVNVEYKGEDRAMEKLDEIKKVVGVA